jgi:predicted DCC family thiol-disulfide oxidoreductase YuxK
MHVSGAEKSLFRRVNESQLNNPDRQNPEPTIIVYDGECPFCSSYVELVSLKESIGAVELKNARDGGPEVEKIIASGFDLDEGMVLLYEGTYYHGAACLHMITLLSAPETTFNRICRMLFRSERMAKILYPVLRAGRNAILRLLGRKKIADGKI